MDADRRPDSARYLAQRRHRRLPRDGRPEPKSGHRIAILANGQKSTEGLGFPLLGAKSPGPKTAVANARDYLGLYPLTPAFAIRVTELNGTLFAQATDQTRLALRPLSNDRFATVGVAAEVAFVRAPDGKVAALVLHQNGADTQGPRQPLPSETKEVSLPSDVLAEYAGSYPAAQTFVLTATIENGGLFIQATGQPKIPLFASAKDEFFCKVVDAQVSFTRDADGQVVALVLNQGGRDMPAKKTK